MKLFTRARVVKSYAVEISTPCVLESQTEEFQLLSQRLAQVRGLGENRQLVSHRFKEKEQEEENFLESSLSKEDAQAAERIRELEETAKQKLLEAEMIRAQAEDALITAKNEAQAEKQKLLEQARLEAEKQGAKLREEIREQAYQEGYAQGLKEGFEEGSAQGKKEADRLLEDAQRILSLAQRAAQEEWSKVDAILLRLALKVAERIIRGYILENPGNLIQRIRALSLLPENRQGWKLHVSPADYQWLSQRAEEISIPLYEDQTLNPGDCFLECAEGIFDARVEAQLERCEQLLREELRHDRLA